MRSIVRAIVWIITIFSAGCLPNPPEKIELNRAYNDERRSRRIPIIPSHWTGHGIGEGHWGNPAFSDPSTTSNPMHARKEVFFESVRNLHREFDYYYSGRKYPSKIKSGSLDWEELTICYDYVAAREGKNPWQCTVSCGPHFPEINRSGKMQGEVTLEEAEAILKEWRISRLNY
jgi:hypothetical protein